MRALPTSWSTPRHSARIADNCCDASQRPSTATRTLVRYRHPHQSVRDRAYELRRYAEHGQDFAGDPGPQHQVRPCHPHRVGPRRLRMRRGIPRPDRIRHRWRRRRRPQRLKRCRPDGEIRFGRNSVAWHVAASPTSGSIWRIASAVDRAGICPGAHFRRCRRPSRCLATRSPWNEQARHSRPSLPRLRQSVVRRRLWIRLRLRNAGVQPSALNLNVGSCPWGSTDDHLLRTTDVPSERLFALGAVPDG
jgi:hypothetical protein